MKVSTPPSPSTVRAVRGRDDLNRINGPAREAVDRIEHVEGANQIEIIDRWHGDDDYTTGCRVFDGRPVSSGTEPMRSPHYHERL